MSAPEADSGTWEVCSFWCVICRGVEIKGDKGSEVILMVKMRECGNHNLSIVEIWNHKNCMLTICEHSNACTSTWYQYHWKLPRGTPAFMDTSGTFCLTMYPCSTELGFFCTQSNYKVADTYPLRSVATHIIPCTTCSTIDTDRGPLTYWRNHEKPVPFFPTVDHHGGIGFSIPAPQSLTHE